MNRFIWKVLKLMKIVMTKTRKTYEDRGDILEDVPGSSRENVDPEAAQDSSNSASTRVSNIYKSVCSTLNGYSVWNPEKLSTARISKFCLTTAGSSF